MSHDPNSPPRKAPPAPPRRPPPPAGNAQQAEQRQQAQQPPPSGNPFVASGDPTPPLPTVNPFLEQGQAAPEPQADQPAPGGQGAPQQPQRPVAQAPVARAPEPQRQRQASPPAGHQGMEAPRVRDAHAEFRQGRSKKPFVLGAVGAVLLAGIAVLATSGQEPAKTSTQPVAAKKEPASVIGSSLPPERKTLKEETAADHKEAFDRTEEAARQQEEGSAPSAKPSDIPDESEFVKAFKEAAEE